jgi:hypothetical protein
MIVGDAPVGDVIVRQTRNSPTASDAGYRSNGFTMLAADPDDMPSDHRLRCPSIYSLPAALSTLPESTTELTEFAKLNPAAAVSLFVVRLTVTVVFVLVCPVDIPKDPEVATAVS